MRSDRLMFVDIVRGLAIIGVIVVHADTYGIWYSEANALNVLPPAAVAGLSPIILLATWAGAFALITGLVNAYNVHKRLEKGRPLREVCTAPAINAAVLFGIWVIVALLLTHRRHGIFGGDEVFSLISGSLALGRFKAPDLQTLYYKDALVMIALSGWVSAAALRLVHRRRPDGGVEISAAAARRRSNVLFASGAAFLALSAVLQPPAFILFERLWRAGTPAALVAAWFVNLFSGPSHVLFPYGGFALIGTALGLSLAAGEDFRRIRRLCLSYGLAFTAVSALFIGRTVAGALAEGGNPLVALFDYLVITPGLFFFAAGSILLLFPLIVRRTEYRPQSEREEIFRKTVRIRRFGMISLSVFILENPVTAGLGRVFHLIFGNPDAPTDAFMTNAFAIGLYFVLTMSFWFLAVRLWEKAGFKYSFEWLSIKIGGLMRKTASNRLDVRSILYGE